MSRLRRRGPHARPLFLMTRSNVILDLDEVGSGEALIYCQPNHGPPIHVPHVLRFQVMKPRHLPGVPGGPSAYGKACAPRCPSWPEAGDGARRPPIFQSWIMSLLTE